MAWLRRSMKTIFAPTNKKCAHSVPTGSCKSTNVLSARTTLNIAEAGFSKGQDGFSQKLSGRSIVLSREGLGFCSPCTESRDFNFGPGSRYRTMGNLNTENLPTAGYRSSFPDSQIQYFTPQGFQAVGDSRILLEKLPPGSIDLIMTSPPFALQRQKSYGNEEQTDYVAWLSEFGALSKRVLKERGSLVIDLGGAYQKGRPVRSLYNYRVLLDFCDNLGYNLAEEFFWHNPAKLPSPIQWVNKEKIRVKDSVNTIWWFSKGDNPKADTRNVLTPYKGRMKQLLLDPGAFYKPMERPSGHDISKAFGKDNGGAIPSNLLSISNSASNSFYLRTCKALDLPRHPARFPETLPKFFIRLLTEPQDVILDIFSGSNTTGYVAQQEGRNWISFEMDSEYAQMSAIRFMEKWSLPEIGSTLRRVKDGCYDLAQGPVEVLKPKNGNIS